MIPNPQPRCYVIPNPKRDRHVSVLTLAGASHYITAAGLHKASSVAREKRKRDILEASQSQLNGGAGPSRGNKKRTVLSVNEDDESEDIE